MFQLNNTGSYKEKTILSFGPLQPLFKKSYETLKNYLIGRICIWIKNSFSSISELKILAKKTIIIYMLSGEQEVLHYKKNHYLHDTKIITQKGCYTLKGFLIGKISTKVILQGGFCGDGE